MPDLDDAYANAAYIPGSDAYPDRWTQDAQAFRQSLGERAELAIPYGSHPRQQFDLFRPEGEAKGLFVFIHGGYWLRFDRSFWSHFAQGALDRGWAVAMPSYVLAPEVRIKDITRMVAQAVVAAAKQVSGPIRLAGHSAGGHLSSRMLAPGLLPDDVLARVEKAVPISPVADLRPMLRTSMNDDFKMDMADAEAESPVLQPAPNVPVTVWVGGDERPVFLEQARALGTAWGVDCTVTEGEHHFNVIDGLANAGAPLCKAIFES